MKIAPISCFGLLFLLSSCGGSSPDHVAADFSFALNDLNFDQTKTSATKKTHNLIHLIESAASMTQKDGTWLVDVSKENLMESGS